MSFIWPPMLRARGADPAGRARLPCHRAPPPPAARRATACWRRPASHRRHRHVGSAAGYPAPCMLVGLAAARHRDGAAAGGHQRPARRGHRHPRLRRVGQHGRHRPAADPDGGGQGSRPRVRRASSHRPSGSGSSPSATAGCLGPGPDRRSDPGRGRDRPARSGARDVDRRRHPVRARGDRRGGRGPGGRLLHERITRPDRRAHTGAGGLARRRGRRSC